MNLRINLDFAVVGETEDVLAINKAAPLLTHPTNNNGEPTLLDGVELLAAYETALHGRPAALNRLDRETSGLALFAKTKAAARKYGMALQSRQAVKSYLAVTQGWAESDAWDCDAPLIRAARVGLSAIWVRQIVHPRGKESYTRFVVEKRFMRGGKRFSLVRCEPETGRTHQVRVHLAHGGLPIAGDKLYSGDGAEYLHWLKYGWDAELQRRLPFHRCALHCEAMTLAPQGETLCWQAPLASDILDFIAGREFRQPATQIIWNDNDTTKYA